MKKYIIILLSILSISINAQNTGPNAIEALAFEPVDATDIVNLLTGDASYVIPLLEVPGPEGGYPISLSYHAGIGVDQEASWVGLGWNVNPGAINRGINGAPDDSKAELEHIIQYNSGVTQTSYNLDVSFTCLPAQGLNVGYSSSWGSNQASYGRVHLGIGLSKTTSEFGASISFSADSRGNIGLSAGLSNRANHMGLGIGVSSGPDGFTYGGSLGMIGAGISLSSESGVSLSVGPGVVNLSGNGLQTSDIARTTLDYVCVPLYVPIPWIASYFSIKYEYNKSHYSLYRCSNHFISGSLYLESARKIESAIGQQDKDYSMDTYTPNEISGSDPVSIHNTMLLPSYDSYDVNAQGLNGSFSPNLFEYGNIVGEGRILSFWENKSRRELNYNYEYNNDPLTITNERFTKDKDKLYFNMLSENNSYLRIVPSDISFDNSCNTQYPDIVSCFNIDKANSLDHSVLVNGKSKSNYNINRERKGGSSYIEWISNHDIIEEINLQERGYIKTNSIAEEDLVEGRRDASKFPIDGIGAINITVKDGKTYHYSLPVYQFEIVQYDRDFVTTNEEVSFSNERSHPYAYTWLLTSITGPDYVDANSNGAVDSEDYGYWIEFDYGKWTDGYIWKIPYSQESVNPYSEEGLDIYYDMNSHKRGCMTYGRKQIYYLNSIKTRSHTAFFVKDVRKDGLGYSGNFSYPDNTVYPGLKSGEDLRYYSYVSSTDGYFVNLQTGEGYKDVDLNQMPTWGQYQNQIYYKKEYEVLHKEKLLCLSKIYIVNNKDAYLFQKDRSTSFVVADPIESTAPKLIKYANFRDINGHIIPNLYMMSNQSINISPDNLDGDPYYSYFKDNILDIYDIQSLTADDKIKLESSTLKFLKFNYASNPSEALSKNAPNIENPTDGKLTLRSLTSKKSENSIQLIPGYSFSYYPMRDYNRDNMDDWGFDKDFPWNWSLRNINTPTGAVINLVYESDQFDKILQGKDETNQELINSLDLELEGQEYNTFISANGGLTTVFHTGDAFDIKSNLFIEIGEPGNCHRGTDEEITYHTIVSVTDNTIIFTPSLVDALELHPYGNCQGRVLIPEEVTISHLYNEFNLNGGGIRVERINVFDNFNNKYTTTYKYNEPYSTKSSGVTSFVPSKHAKFIQFKDLLPSPYVLYKNVEVKTYKNDNMDSEYYTYEFDVPDYWDSENKRLNNFFWIEELCTPNQVIAEYNLDDNSIKANKRSSIIHDNLSSIGRPLKISNYNSINQVICSRIYNYQEPTIEMQGVTQESFIQKKSIIDWEDDDHLHYNKYWYLNSTSVVKYPSLLNNIIIEYGNGSSSQEKYLEYDFNTGKIVKLLNKDLDGNYNLTQIVYAYSIPYYGNSLGMGSKVDDPTFKNMLNQEAARYSYVSDLNAQKLKIKSVNIQTWNNSWTYRKYDYLNNVFIDYLEMNQNPYNDPRIPRKYSNFVWNGPLNADGTYLNCDILDEDNEYVSWASYYHSQNPTNNWLQPNKVTRYSHFSVPIEEVDINGNYESTKLGYTYLSNQYTQNNEEFSQRIIGTAKNANFRSFGCSSFESCMSSNSGSYLWDGEITSSTSTIQFSGYNTQIVPHSGLFCAKIPPTSSGPCFKMKTSSGSDNLSGLQTGRIYRASVWIHNSSPGDTKLIGFIDGTNTGHYTPLEIKKSSINNIVVGDWTLMYLDFDVPANYISSGGSSTNDFRFYIKNEGSEFAYVDDFRISPIDADVITYVYNSNGQTCSILDNNNFATYYYYDLAGRLIEVKVETQEFGVQTTRKIKYSKRT